MALIVEDGSIVEDADSFISAADAITYCTSMGLDFTTDVVQAEIQIRRAMEILIQRDNDFRGQLVDLSQSLPWPRKDDYQSDGLVTLSNGKTIAQDEIPKQLKNALCMLASVAVTSTSLQPNSTGQVIIHDQVSTLITKYASPSDGGTSGDTTYFTAFEKMLQPLLFENYGNGTRTNRI